MLLDEPTNHLDVYTRGALEEALEEFSRIIVVSHRFLHRPCTRRHPRRTDTPRCYAATTRISWRRSKRALQHRLEGRRIRPPHTPTAAGRIGAGAPTCKAEAQQAREKNDKEAMALLQVAHRLGRVSASATICAPVRGSLSRRRALEENPAAELRSRGDDQSALRKVGDAGRGRAEGAVV